MLDPKQEEDYSIQKRRLEGLYKTYYKVRKYNKLDIHKGFQKDIESTPEVLTTMTTPQQKDDADDGNIESTKNATIR
ncbi:hypothetical protein M8J75_000208 [Diaphorina citri]|nr:hypothetical protein M8J75_000208 [Diaphorina citri]